MALLKWPRTQSKSCPNCSKPIAGHRDACALGVLVQCVRDRGEKSPALCDQIQAEADPDALWAALGPVIDRLEAGEFSR